MPNLVLEVRADQTGLNQIKAVLKDFQNAVSDTAGLKRSFHDLRLEVIALKDTYKNAQKELNQFSAEQAKIKASIAATATEVAKVTAANDKLTESNKRLKDRLVDVGVEKRKVQNATNGVVESSKKLAASTVQNIELQKNLHAALRGTSGALGGLWLTYGKILPMALAFAQTTGLKKAFEFGSEFEYQLAIVQGVAEETDSVIRNLRDDLLKMGESGRYAPTELAKGMTILTQAGLSVKQSIETLPEVFKLATLGGVGLEAAAETLNLVFHAFDLTVKDIPHAVDSIAKAAAISATNVAQMSAAITNASQIGALYNTTLDETNAMLAVLAQRHMVGQRGGTALTNMMAEMAPKGEEAARMFRAIGVDAYDAEGNMKPIIPLLGDMAEKLKRFTPEAQAGILKTIYNLRSIKAAVPLLQEAQTTLPRMYLQVLESSLDGGFAAKSTQKLNQTVKVMTEEARAAIETNLIEAFYNARSGIEDLTKAFRDFIKSNGFKEFVSNVVTGSVDAVNWLRGHLDLVVGLTKAYITLKAAQSGINLATAGLGFLGLGAAGAAQKAAGNISGLVAMRNALVAIPTVGWAAAAAVGAVTAAALSDKGRESFKFIYDELYRIANIKPASDGLWSDIKKLVGSGADTAASSLGNAFAQASDLINTIDAMNSLMGLNTDLDPNSKRDTFKEGAEKLQGIWNQDPRFSAVGRLTASRSADREQAISEKVKEIDQLKREAEIWLMEDKTVDERITLLKDLQEKKREENRLKEGLEKIGESYKAMVSSGISASDASKIAEGKLAALVAKPEGGTETMPTTENALKKIRDDFQQRRAVTEAEFARDNEILSAQRQKNLIGEADFITSKDALRKASLEAQRNDLQVQLGFLQLEANKLTDNDKMSKDERKKIDDEIKSTKSSIVALDIAMQGLNATMGSEFKARSAAFNWKIEDIGTAAENQLAISKLALDYTGFALQQQQILLKASQEAQAAARQMERSREFGDIEATKRAILGKGQRELESADATRTGQLRFAAKETVQAMELQLASKRKANKLIMDSVFMTQLEREEKEALLDIDNKMSEERLKREQEKTNDEYLTKVLAQLEEERSYTIEFYNEKKARQNDWLSGAKAGMQDYHDTLTDVFSSARDVVSSSFKGMEDALVEFVKTGKFSVSSFFDSILEGMARIMVQKQIMPGIESLVGKGIDSLSGEANLFSNIGSFFTSLLSFDKGGWVNEPVVGQGMWSGRGYSFAERRPEFVSNGNPSPINVIINNNNGSNVRAQETRSANGERSMEIVIDEAMAKAYNSGGRFYNALNNTFQGRR